MRPLLLVLLIATSALASPLQTVEVTEADINEIEPCKDNGRYISSCLTNRAFESSDQGDTNIYILDVERVIDQLANSPDIFGQTLAVSQTLAVLEELATGIPGDSCEYAALIDSYVNWRETGKSGALRIAYKNYFIRVFLGIDNIVRSIINPEAARYTTGPRGNCVGGGRRYQFNAAWDSIIDSAGPKTNSLINEEYCAAQRLYSAFQIRSNNVGAAITAAAIPGVAGVFQDALPQIANLLRAIISGKNLSQAANLAKEALLKSTQRPIHQNYISA